jgi:hypothetical protein
MAQIDLALATVEWLNAHLAKHGTIAASVPRTPDEARRQYLESALSLSIKERFQTGSRYLFVSASGDITADTFRRLLDSTIVDGPLVYRFTGLDPRLGLHEGDSPYNEIDFELVPTPKTPA